MEDTKHFGHIDFIISNSKLSDNLLKKSVRLLTAMSHDYVELVALRITDLFQVGNHFSYILDDLYQSALSSLFALKQQSITIRKLQNVSLVGKQIVASNPEKKRK